MCVCVCKYVLLNVTDKECYMNSTFLISLQEKVY